MNLTGWRALPHNHVIVRAAGERLRVCVEHRLTTRVLLWLLVGRDGSLYTGVGGKGPRARYRLVPTQLVNGSWSFSWDDRELMDAAKWRPKVSFHASGLIISPTGRSIGVNLRLLTMRTLLCVYLPKHPEHWRVVSKEKREDIFVRDLLQDERPLSIELYYQPVGKLPVLESDLRHGVIVLPIGYTGIVGHERVLLHLVLRCQANAVDWPPHWTMAWPLLDGRTKPSEREQWIEQGL